MASRSRTAAFPGADRTTPARTAGIALAGALLLAVAAHLQIPFWPVPMTMQTFVVFTLGATGGARRAGLAVLAYLAAGLAGLPVFASGAGPLYMAGPTGGYLLGFLLAAMLVGAAAGRGWLRRLPTAVAVLLAADVVLFACGVVWLAVLIGWQKAFAAGVLPFLPAEAAKVALAAAVTRVAALRLG